MPSEVAHKFCPKCHFPITPDYASDWLSCSCRYWRKQWMRVRNHASHSPWDAYDFTPPQEFLVPYQQALEDKVAL
jgi:hypothetical protein